MNVAKLVLFVVYYVLLSSKARLLKNNPETSTIALITSNLHTVRLTREIYDGETLIGLSKERERLIDGNVGFIDKSLKLYSKPETSKKLPHARMPRASNENSVATLQIKADPQPLIEEKKVLVKKPIPKFKETDYDDDFQIKINTRPVRVTDSREHEDEDFNVDDYEFDVNHDEFSGRGKPLEPRTKLKKKIIKADSQPKVTFPPPETKLQNIVVLSTPPIESPKSEKKIKKSIDKAETLKEDYYDDISTSTKSPEKKKEPGESEQSDESEESSEFEPRSMRNFRSRTTRIVPTEGATMADETPLSNVYESNSDF